MVESSPAEFMDCCETPPPVAGRFLKLLIPGFETALKLPPAFSRMLNNTDLDSKWAVLKSCKGSSWEIDVKKCDHGCLHFLGNTWEGYVSDHNLNEGDIIIFEHIGRLHFNTIMFDEAGCEKHFAVSEEDEEDDIEQMDGGRENTPHNDADSTSRFQLRLARCNITHYYMMVPPEIGRSNGMRQGGTVQLRNAIGDSWQAKVNVINKFKGKKGGSKRRFFRIIGLSAFYRDNQLKEEDICILKLKRSSPNHNHFVMDVTFVRK